LSHVAAGDRRQRQRRGISDAMIRLSIGLEEPAELVADLEQALGGAGG
jgi:cystathionine beta-lyase/cystathionine gamma-synthase